MSNRFADYDNGIYPSKTTSQKSFGYNVKPGVNLDDIKSAKLKKKIENFSKDLGFEPTYTSGYRSQEEQDALPTTDKNKYSKHTLGLAYDQRVKDLTPEQIEKAIQYYKQDPNINAFVHEGTGRHLHIEDIGDTQLEAIKKRTSGNRFAEFDNLLTPKQPQVPEGPGLLSSAKDNVLKGLLNIGKFGNKVYDAIPSLNQNPALVDTETFRPSLDPRPDAFKSLYANDPATAITGKPIISEELGRNVVHGATALTPYGMYRSFKKGDVSPIAKGLESFGAKTISSFSTPESIVMAAGLATPAAPALLAGMTPGMIKGSYDEVDLGKQALQAADKEAATEHFANAILNTGMAAGGVFGLGRMATPKISKNASMQEIKDATIPPPPPPTTPPQMPAAAMERGNVVTAPKKYSETPTLPESPQTIDIQMQALAEGRVPAVMVTKGAEMPQVPEGFKVHNTKLGEFIYDPMILAPEEIQARVDLGEHGQLLGHLEPKSPEATQTVAAIMPDGTEAKTSIVSPENIEPQAAILKQEFPESEIKVGGEELASQVLDTRRANNGGIKLRSGVDPIEAFEQLKEHLNKDKEIKGFAPQDYVKEMVEKREASREAPGTSKIKGIYKQAKSDLVDFASPIEDTVALAQKKYGYEILPKYDVTNQIDRSLRSHTLAGKFIEDSKLPDVIQKVDNIDALDQYLIARHAKTLEGKGIKTGRESSKDTAFLEANKAKYEPMAREVTKYSRNLLNYSVESGLISKDLATRLNNIYPDYVPFKRIFNELEKQHGIHTTKAVASLSNQTVVQKIKGSVREIDSPIASLLEKTYDAFSQGEKNKAAKILAEHKGLPGFEGLIKELPKGDSAPHTFSFLDNGKKRTFETTPEIAAAAKALDVQQLNILGEILAAPVRVAKLGITGVNLPFVLSNIVRDQITGFINSQHGLKTSVANPAVFAKSLFNALKHGDLYNDMVRNAAGGTSFDLVRNQPVKTLNKIRSGKSLKSKIAYSAKNPSELFRALENVIGRSEELGRLQQFGGTKEALLKEGRTLEDANILASKAARENTANFYRRGNYGKVLNGAFLYLNAGIQGSRALVRAIERSPVKTSAKIATAIYLPMTMLTLWNLSDPKRKSAYEDIEDFEKENNLIYIPDNPTMNDKGQWNVIKMPLPPGVSSLAIPVRRFIEQANGMDKVKFGEMAQALIGSVSPIEPDTKKLLSSITPQAIKPTLEAQTNTNFFTGKPIVPANLSKKPKKMQVYPWTSGTAKKIADLTDSSPIQVEQFIKGTFGGLGAQGLNLSDRTLAELGLINEEEIGGQDVLEAIAARFNAARGGKKKRLFYEKKKEIESRL